MGKISSKSIGQKSKGILDTVLNALKDIFAPNLVALTAAGILQGFTILLHSLGWIQEGNAEAVILETIAGAVFYFLPVLLAYSSAKVFKTNQVLAACVALFMLHPTVTQTFSEGYTMATFFGLPIPYGNYPSSVIPIILIVWAQHYVEKLWDKLIPEIVSGIFTPMLTLVTTSIIAIAFLGPIGTIFGEVLLGVITFLNEQVYWLAPALLGGFGLFIVMTGAHYSLFPVVTQSLATVGYDSFFVPGMLMSNVAIAGAAAAVFFKSKNNGYKQYSITSTVTALLGVSQPALYGIAIPFKRVMVASVVGGLVGGLYTGFARVYSYAFANPGLAAFPVFISPEGWGNMVNAIIAMLISFIVAFVIVFTGKFEDMPDEEINKITAENEME